MHCDMLKIQDGGAIVEKLNYSNYHGVSEKKSQIDHLY